MDIAFGFDRAYVPHVATIITSIIKHTGGNRIRFLMLGDDFEADIRNGLERHAPGATFKWIAMPDDVIPAKVNGGRITRATYYRLLLDELAPADCDRVLYLDSDLAITGDISGLWNIDLGGKPIGAVKEAMGECSSFAREFGLPMPSDYFNAGILVIDLKQVREKGLFRKARDFLEQHIEQLDNNDQDALNVVFWRNWQPMSRTWNFQMLDALKAVEGHSWTSIPASASSPPRIIHFTGHHKPWVTTAYHPWAWLYWRSLAETGYADRVTRESGISISHKLKLWLRWLLRYPGYRAAITPAETRN